MFDFGEGRQMKEYDELLELAAQSDLPSAFISAVWAYAKSLQDLAQTQEPSADLPVKAFP